MIKINMSEAFKTSIIAVDKYNSKEFSAKLYNPFYRQSIEITSLQHLIKRLDILMDEIGCPMSGMEKRSFVKHRKVSKKAMFIGDKSQTPKGEIATFAMRIQYRNNASWQGSLRWIEGDAEEYFRSVLELFWLIDSALKDDKKENGKDEENLNAVL